MPSQPPLFPEGMPPSVTILTSLTGNETVPIANAGPLNTVAPVWLLTNNVPAQVITAAGGVTMATTDFEVILNKTVGAATAVTLPPTPVLGQQARVSDGKGDAGSNNITVSGAAGAQINGASTSVINSAYGSRLFRFNGTSWNVVA